MGFDVRTACVDSVVAAETKDYIGKSNRGCGEVSGFIVVAIEWDTVEKPVEGPTS